MRQGRSRVIGGADFVKARGRAKNKFKSVVRKIGFFRLKLRVGFSFRLLVFRNFFAKAAGMFAVESALEGALPGRRVKIFREHRGPREGLKCEPMCAGRREDGNDHQHMAKFAEHADTIFERGGRVKGSGSAVEF